MWAYFKIIISILIWFNIVLSVLTIWFLLITWNILYMLYYVVAMFIMIWIAFTMKERLENK